MSTQSRQVVQCDSMVPNMAGAAACSSKPSAPRLVRGIVLSVCLPLFALSGCGAGGGSSQLSTVVVNHDVYLSWDPPEASGGQIAGYDIYRSPAAMFKFQKLNPSPVDQTFYMDSATQIGQSYDYFIVSVGVTGVSSDWSNIATAFVPN